MQESDKTTITLTKEAKKILDVYGHKNENYSDLIIRITKDCDCKSKSEKTEQEGCGE
ncbi:MAG: hypothetical protein ACREBB_11825 [Nitrosotalea sp.]